MPPRSRAALIAASAVLALLAAPSAASAHTIQKAGPYTLEIGWNTEPTYVGIPNGVQVTVTDASDKPVNDLTSDDLHVIVSTNGQSSQSLTFDPAFDLEEMDGPFGQYDAAILPTAPGDYTFHITGSIHGQNVDVTVTSGDSTFNSVVESSDLQFPAKLPSVSELSTKVDRVDTRAGDAQDAATLAIVVGSVVGGIGIVIGLAAVVLARRASKRAA